jgi:hypothetical protein
MENECQQSFLLAPLETQGGLNKICPKAPKAAGTNASKMHACKILSLKSFEQVRSANAASDYQAALVQIFKTSDQLVLGYC